MVFSTVATIGSTIAGFNGADDAKDAELEARAAGLRAVENEQSRAASSLTPQQLTGNLAFFNLAESLGLGPIGQAFTVNNDGSFAFQPELAPETGLGFGRTSPGIQVIGDDTQRVAQDTLNRILADKPGLYNNLTGGVNINRTNSFINQVLKNDALDALSPAERDATRALALEFAGNNSKNRKVANALPGRFGDIFETEDFRSRSNEIITDASDGGQAGSVLSNILDVDPANAPANTPTSVAGSGTQQAERGQLVKLNSGETVATPNIADEQQLFDLAQGRTAQLQNFTRDQFETSPGYEFRKNEGLEAVKRQAAATGQTLGPALQKALLTTADGLASQEYDSFANRLDNRFGFFTNTGANRTDNLFNRQAAVANVGQVATNNLNTLGANSANVVAGGQGQQGQAAANGINTQTGIIQSGIAEIGEQLDEAVKDISLKSIFGL